MILEEYLVRIKFELKQFLILLKKSFTISKVVIFFLKKPGIIKLN